VLRDRRHQTKKKKKNADWQEYTVVSNGFENALDWELVKIGIVVAS
jgi:hypothetical protein